MTDKIGCLRNKLFHSAGDYAFFKEKSVIPDSLKDFYLSHVNAQVAMAESALSSGEFDNLVIYGGGLSYRFRDDTSYPFRINPYLARFAPLQAFTDCWLILADGRPKLLVRQSRDFWHKQAEFNDSVLKDAFDIEVYDEAQKVIQSLNGLTGKTAVISEKTPDVFEQLNQLELFSLNPSTVLNYIDFHCAIKTEYEIACIKEASDLGAVAHTQALRSFEQGKSEFQIHLDYLQSIAVEAHELPYDNIIALNENAAILHYTHRSRTAPQKPLSMLIDAGACYLGYNSDISRTYLYPSVQSSAARDCFRGMLSSLDQAQKTLIDDIKPGVNYRDLHLRAHQKIAQILVDVGLVNASVDAAWATNITSTFFPHGLGHFLGLQVHDKGGWLANDQGETNPPPQEHPFLRLTRPIAAGQVFTIEPGIYFIPMLLEQVKATSNAKLVNWSLLDELLPYGGIRIEDNIAVTETGSQNLTRAAFANI